LTWHCARFRTRRRRFTERRLILNPPEFRCSHDALGEVIGLPSTGRSGFQLAIFHHSFLSRSISEQAAVNVAAVTGAIARALRRRSMTATADQRPSLGQLRFRDDEAAHRPLHVAQIRRGYTSRSAIGGPVCPAPIASRHTLCAEMKLEKSVALCDRSGVVFPVPSLRVSHTRRSHRFFISAHRSACACGLSLLAFAMFYLSSFTRAFAPRPFANF
jgi:hypothetical protein